MNQRVLIVEDEASIATSLSFIMRRAGFEVIAVRDGPAAIQALKDDPPQVLILDVLLPGMNGFDILRQVRADPETKALPVVMLTAKMQAQDKRLAEEIGVSAFLAKPFSNAEVVSTVRQLMPSAS